MDEEAFQNRLHRSRQLPPPVHLVWSSPQLASISVHMFREVAQLRKRTALRFHAPGVESFNIEIWRDAAFNDAVQMINSVAPRYDQWSYAHYPSMLQDVLAGKQTEMKKRSVMS